MRLGQPVEFVEASPRPALDQPCEDAPHALEVDPFIAVEHQHLQQVIIEELHCQNQAIERARETERESARGCVCVCERERERERERGCAPYS